MVRHALTVFFVFCSVANAQPMKKSLATPEHTFATINAANSKQDWKTYCACLSPGRKNELLFAVAFAMGSGASSDEAEKILAKYVDDSKITFVNTGQEERDAIAGLSSGVEDKDGMLIASLSYLQEQDPRMPQLPQYVSLGRVHTDASCAAAIATEKTFSRSSTLDRDGRSRNEIVAHYRNGVDVFFIRFEEIWLFATEEEYLSAKGRTHHHSKRTTD